MNDSPRPADFICEKYGISIVTLWRWRATGLPARKVGAKVFILESDVQAFIESNGRQVKEPAK